MPRKKQANYQIIASNGNGEIKLVLKDNIYYIKFPSHICHAIWGQRQKSISTGIKAYTRDASTGTKPETLARKIWQRACEDAQTGYEAIKANYRQYNFKNIYRIIADDRETCPSLHNICSEWFYKKKSLDKIEKTTKLEYENNLKTLQRCPQDLFDLEAIKEWLIQKADSGPRTAKKLLAIIKNSLKWGKETKRISSSLPINMEGWNQDIKRVSEKRCPFWAKEKDYFKHDQEYRGFTLKDEETVLEELKVFQWKKYAPGQFYILGKLRFLTGSRPGEAMALRWGHFDENYVNEDEGRFGVLHFQASFSVCLQEDKTIKNHKNHSLPCDKELADFLIKIRPKNYKPGDYIIEPNLKGIDRRKFAVAFTMCWHGETIKTKSHPTGLMEKLLDEGRLTQPIYRSPYATRHTFITRQINAGIPMATVAMWVGDDLITLAKHYLGADHTRVPIRPSTTQRQPASAAPSSSQTDSATQALINFLKSEVEAQKEQNAELQKRLDEMHQIMLKLVSPVV
jgi:integrase